MGVPECLGRYPWTDQLTVKLVALVAFPPGVITLTLPVVAPAGTVTLIFVPVFLVIVPVTLLMVTLVAPSKLVPEMVITVPTGPEAGVKLVIVGGPSTVRVKLWVASDPTPLWAVKVIGKVPVTVGVPESTPVAAAKCTPVGSAPDLESVGVGVPVAVTVKDPAVPVQKVAALPEVIAGACPALIGVTAEEAAEAAPVPLPLVAVTVKV